MFRDELSNDVVGERSGDAQDEALQVEAGSTAFPFFAWSPFRIETPADFSNGASFASLFAKKTLDGYDLADSVAGLCRNGTSEVSFKAKERSKVRKSDTYE